MRTKKEKVEEPVSMGSELNPLDPTQMSLEELKILAFDTSQEAQKIQNFYIGLVNLIAEKTNALHRK